MVSRKSFTDPLHFENSPANGNLAGEKFRNESVSSLVNCPKNKKRNSY